MRTIEQHLREINREILDLKTSQPHFAGMRTFWAEHEFVLEAYVPSPYDPHVNTSYYFEITYADGNQPILTDFGPLFQSDRWIGMAVLESPSNNKQLFVIWDTGYGETVDFWFSSTRQILGIRRVNPPN